MVVCIYGGLYLWRCIYGGLYLWWSVSIVVCIYGGVSMVVFRVDQGDDLWMTFEWHSAAPMTSRIGTPDGATLVTNRR